MDVARRLRLQERPVDGGVGHPLAEARTRPGGRGRSRPPRIADHRAARLAVAARRTASLARTSANIAQPAQLVAIVGRRAAAAIRPRRPAGTRRSPRAARTTAHARAPVSGATTSTIASAERRHQVGHRAASRRAGLSSIQMIGASPAHRGAPPADLDARGRGAPAAGASGAPSAIVVGVSRYPAVRAAKRFVIA